MRQPALERSSSTSRPAPSFSTPSGQASTQAAQPVQPAAKSAAVHGGVLVYHEILHDDDSNDAAAMTDRAIPCSPEETIDEPHPS